MSRSLPGITVALATHNDAEFVQECLESVRDIASEIVVADGASNDGTLAAVERYGAHVIHTDNKLMLNVNKNLAIDAARHEWILLLDPDERVTSELAAELQGTAASSNGHSAYWLRRRDFELGRWLHETSLSSGSSATAPRGFPVSTSTRWSSCRARPARSVGRCCTSPGSRSSSTCTSAICTRSIERGNFTRRGTGSVCGGSCSGPRRLSPARISAAEGGATACRA